MQVASAHSCYLVAELNIDPYTESARMCLIGADHLRSPRTFASPEAIQVKIFNLQHLIFLGYCRLSSAASASVRF
jgi:hypothetical protein